MPMRSFAAGLLCLLALAAASSVARAEFRIRTLQRSAPSWYCVWQEEGRSGRCRFAAPAKVGARCDCVAGQTVHHGMVSKIR